MIAVNHDPSFLGNPAAADRKDITAKDLLT